MYKFVIDVKEVHTVPVKVDAKTVEEALQKAMQATRNGELDYEHMEFSQTLDPATWNVYQELEPGSDKYDLVY